MLSFIYRSYQYKMTKPCSFEEVKVLLAAAVLFQVLVMTPAVMLLNNLRHHLKKKLSMVKGLIMDECHHARSNHHPYACIMKTMSIMKKSNRVMSQVNWSNRAQMMLMIILCCITGTQLS
ncbi:uncharacterized protein LOC126797926 [Argentina anserina]|uniref:uncharacterized protein LOC126797926 n=1 Tax=Argentina anserina TaxID=57926 RepID=UPI0021768BFD|nr:uncharacterized protein LOC126797926 [Potentilla anserina]